MRWKNQELRLVTYEQQIEKAKHIARSVLKAPVALETLHTKCVVCVWWLPLSDGARRGSEACVLGGKGWRVQVPVRRQPEHQGED